MGIMKKLSGEGCKNSKNINFLVKYDCARTFWFRIVCVKINTTARLYNVAKFNKTIT